MLSLTVSGLEDVEQLGIVLAKLTTVCVAPLFVSYVLWECCHFLLTTLRACEFFTVKNKQKSNNAVVLMRKLFSWWRE